MNIIKRFKEKKEIASMLKSLLETEFKEIKERIFLRFSKSGVGGKTWRDSKGRSVIEVNINFCLKSDTKSLCARAFKEILRHELLHILTKRTDIDLEFVREAQERHIVYPINLVLEYYQNKKWDAGIQKWKEK